MTDELRGKDAAKALVRSLEDMLGATIPVSHVDRYGRLQEWKVTVELISIIDAKEPKP